MGYWKLQVEYVGFTKKMEEDLRNGLQKLKAKPKREGDTAGLSAVSTITDRIKNKYPDGFIITSSSGLEKLKKDFPQNKDLMLAVKFFKQNQDTVYGCQADRAVFLNDAKIAGMFGGYGELERKFAVSTMLHELTHASDQEVFPNIPEEVLNHFKVEAIIRSLLGEDAARENCSGEEQRYRDTMKFLYEYQKQKGKTHEILPTAIETLCMAYLEFGKEYGYSGFDRITQELNRNITEGMGEYFRLMDGRR